MRKTSNIGLSLYDPSDKMIITNSDNSLNHNMEIIDETYTNLKNTIETEITPPPQKFTHHRIFKRLGDCT